MMRNDLRTVTLCLVQNLAPVVSRLIHLPTRHIVPPSHYGVIERIAYIIQP